MQHSDPQHKAGTGRIQEPSPSPEGHPAQLAIGVIGAGRAGSAMAASLARAGHRVIAASAVSEASLRRIRDRLAGAEVLRPEDVVAAADLVLLTVPDDVLPGLVAGLARTGVPLQGRLLAHASGRHGLGVLEPATRAGALPLALHPVMTFTGRPDDADKLAGCCFGVTAPDELRPVAEALVLEMGGECVFIAEEARGIYHAALASAANHLVTLVVQAQDLLAGAGVPSPARMLAPLLQAALENSLAFGDAALTGPVARGDASTVAAHVAAIGAAAPQALPAYLALAGHLPPGLLLPLMRSACSACSPGRPHDPGAGQDPDRDRRRAGRAGLPGHPGADNGRTARRPPGADPEGTRDCPGRRVGRGLGVRQSAAVRPGYRS
jgi:predicted short-subunit dehydrogenase-like oxidoreductase (DUF2520 family)